MQKIKSFENVVFVKRKISKIVFSIFLPIACFLLIGIFSFANVTNYVSAIDHGGSIFVGVYSSFDFTGGSISNCKAILGGGVYVSQNGSFNMSGGMIYKNTVSATYGSDIFNSGTFTMTGGTVGMSGLTVYAGIYNSGSMYIYDGTVYDDIYSTKTFYTKTAASILGTITLTDDANIVVNNFSGSTPSYKIKVSSNRGTGVLIAFKGSASTMPDISKFTISGYNTTNYKLSVVKNTSGTYNGYYTLNIVENKMVFPTTWKTEIASTTYMTTTLTPANLTSIMFEKSVPTGYTKIGTLSTGLPVYQGTTATDIAFVYADDIYSSTTLNSTFSSLSALETISFNNFDTSNASSMSYMFGSCESLISLDLSGFNTSKVSTMYQMFYNCTKLTNLNVSNFNTSKVTDMQQMFHYCGSLTSLDLSSFNTPNVKSIVKMFSDCSALTTLNISGFDYSKITSLWCWMYLCKNLQTITFGDTLNTSNVTNMSYAFFCCNSITNFKEIVKKLDVSNVTNMSYMFNACNVQDCDFSDFDTSKVKYMDHMFRYCKATTLDLRGFDTLNVTDMSGMFQYSDLTSINLSSFNTSNVTTTYQMFEYCEKLTSLDLSNFNTSNVTDMSYMFSMSGLESLDLSNFDTSNVTTFGCMFQSCGKLKTLNISSFNTSNAIKMHNFFIHCKELTSLILTNFNTSKVTTMENMFQGCDKLEVLDVSSFDMSSVTNFSHLLYLDWNTGNNQIKLLKTPYNNSGKIEINTSSTLYDTATGSVVTAIPANVSASKTYAVKVDLTFDANGGTCDTSTLGVYYGIKLSDQNVTLPTASKTGYSFDGWYESTTSTVKYQTSSVFTSAKTLYAKYKSTATRYVEFNETECSLLEHYFKYGDDSSAFGSIGDLTAIEITGIAFLSDFKNSIDAYTRLSESKYTSSGEFQFYLGTPTTDKFKTLMGETVLIIAPANCDGNTYISFPDDVNLDLLINTFSSYTALDLRGWSAKNYDNESITIPSNVLVAILPQDIANKTVYIINSDTKVYRYNGTTYSSAVQMFDASSQPESNGFELVKTFILCENKNSVQTVLEINDEKLLETKRKIKIVSNVKKE